MFEITPFVHNNHRINSYDPFEAMDEFEKDFFGHKTALPKTDIKETEQAYILEAELPGFSKEDIHATVRDGYLTISAEHKSDVEKKDEKTNYLRRERFSSSYTRSFNLDGIAGEQIQASYKDGILSIVLPKAENKPDEGRKLEIQ